jgi:Phage tail lysozyme
MTTPLGTILSFFESKGLTPAQAAGIAGNFQVESSLNPAALNRQEGAIGLAQWENGRRTALQNYARATGGSEDNLLTQLGYAWQELSGPESGALAKLKATNDPGTAAAVFDQYYERSSGSSRATRIKDAQAIAAGNPTSTGSTMNAGFWIPNPFNGDVVPTPDQAAGDAKALDALNPFKGWQKDLFGIALKATAAIAAGALVIVGAVHTVSDK